MFMIELVRSADDNVWLNGNFWYFASSLGVVRFNFLFCLFVNAYFIVYNKKEIHNALTRFSGNIRSINRAELGQRKVVPAAKCKRTQNFIDAGIKEFFQPIRSAHILSN